MKDHLAKLIKINGPISISEFMGEALFNPIYGYYNQKNPFGKNGDFTTSPEISQAFGEVIGAYFISLWQTSYASGEINLVEMGAGKGTLMKDLLNVATKIPFFTKKVTINIIETSPRLQEIQKQTLKGYNIGWWSNFDDFYKNNQSRPFFFVANELFDCFPIKQFIKTRQGWAERVVSLDQEGQLVFALDNYSEIVNKAVSDMVQGNAKEGSIFEYAKGAQSLMEEISMAIKISGGVGMIIDYGYVKSGLKNTLQALQGHKYCDVLQEAGNSDLTALVSFDMLRNIVVSGEISSSLVSQKEFLVSLGIRERADIIASGKSKEIQEEIFSSIDRLIDVRQMGELFKVLVFWG